MLRLPIAVEVPPFVTVLLIIGALLAILGLAGEVTIKYAKIGVKERGLRLVAFLVGAVFIAAAVWLYIVPPFTAEERLKLRQGIGEFADVKSKILEERPKESETEVQQRIYDELAKRLGVDAKVLQQKLPQFAEELKGATDATTYERASAAYIAKDYAAAERLGLKAANEAREADPPRTTEAIHALEIAGWSAEKQMKYADRLDHLRAAAKLTDRERDLLEWAQVQYEIALALDRYAPGDEAEQILRTVIDVFAEQRGAEDDYTLGSRLSLGMLLDHEGKYREAAAEERAVLEIEEKQPNRDESRILTLHNNLGLSLYADHQFAEAEKQERYAFEREKDVLPGGLQNRLTLFSLNNLAMALDAQGKHEEAEKDFKQALEGKEKLEELGPDHPDTLFTDYYLAICLKKQGKVEQAKKFAKRAAEGMANLVAQGQLSPNNPNVQKYQKLYEILSGKHSID